MVRQLVMALPIAALVAGGSTACATKRFVRTSVGEVNDKVDSLGRSVEETQERTRQNEGRIAEVDQKAAGRRHRRPSSREHRGATANANATAARVEGRHAPTAKAEALDKASRRLVYEVVLSEDQGNFKFAQHRAARRGEGQDRPDDHAAQGRPEGRLLRDRRAHRQHRARR